MKRFLLAVVMTLGAVSIASHATSQAAPDRGARPTDLITADLGIAEPVFVTCFAGVTPDPDHIPSGAQQRANKAILLECLQAANPVITNDALDKVMDRYRPEGPMRG